MSLPKPCPFCGSGDISIDSYTDEAWFYVCCRECAASGPEDSTEVKAALAWNRRVVDEANNLPSK